MMYGPGIGGWGYGLMSIGMVLIGALVVVGVVILIRYLTGNDRRSAAPATAPPTPEQILAERFARGEIDEPEYRDRLNTLRDTPPGPDDTGTT